jgi:two-component system nitrate/nitrite response regulator NarL
LIYYGIIQMLIAGEQQSDVYLKVVIADDHKLIAEAVKLTLANDEAMIVSTCYDLPSLLELLAAESFDIILLDLSMPGMMGVESIGTVISAAGEGYVVLFTGQIDKHVLDRAFELGVRGLIEKTMPLQSLRSIISLINSGQVFVPVGVDIANQRNGHQENQVLSGNEMHVLQHASNGLTNKEIAIIMDTNEVMIKMYMRAVCKKLGARNRTHAAIIGRELLLI